MKPKWMRPLFSAEARVCSSAGSPGSPDDSCVRPSAVDCAGWKRLRLHHVQRAVLLGVLHFELIAVADRIPRLILSFDRLRRVGNELLLHAIAGFAVVP